MYENKPWMQGPSARDRAKEKMWQGGPTCLIGLLATGGTAMLGFITFWTVIIAIVGFFWFLTGLITYLTGYE